MKQNMNEVFRAALVQAQLEADRALNDVKDAVSYGSDAYGLLKDYEKKLNVFRQLFAIAATAPEYNPADICDAAEIAKEIEKCISACRGNLDRDDERETLEAVLEKLAG